MVMELWSSLFIALIAASFFPIDVIHHNGISVIADLAVTAGMAWWFVTDLLKLNKKE